MTGIALALVLALAQPAKQPAKQPAESRTGGVIFVHPDGAGAATWEAARNLYVGPDADLNWDRLPQIALYRGHLADSLVATSNAGATIHAYGIKVEGTAFGRDRAGGVEPADAAGASLSVAKRAVAAGIPVGLVQSGSAIEPGTAAFLASVGKRADYEDITAALVESGADVLLSGGEEWFLPKGAGGVHGPGLRTDGRDLIAEARELGYALVRTREELLNVPADATRVLGLFAQQDTFNDESEEELAKADLPNYDPAAPTLAEMTDVALRVLGGGEGRPFLLVVEEEGTDNFGNKNNANATLEAVKRADEAIGVAMQYVGEHPDTLLLTTADSDGGGLRTAPVGTRDGEVPAELPRRDWSGAALDGTTGTGGPPFLAAPDASGRRLPFGVVWSSGGDGRRRRAGPRRGPQRRANPRLDGQHRGQPTHPRHAVRRGGRAVRHLGVDYGTRRLGLAISDAGGTFVNPLEVAEVTTPEVAANRVAEVARREDVAVVVIGLPINMDGTEGPSAASVRGWAAGLRPKLPAGAKIVLVDERLTSYDAEQQLVSRKRGGERITRRGKKKRLDALAAAVILRGYLDGELAALPEAVD